MARGDLTPQEIELRKIISNNINSLLDIKNKKQIDRLYIFSFSIGIQ